MLRVELISLIKINASIHQVDPYILRAICMVESGGHSYACRFEESWQYFTLIEEMAKKNGITEATEKTLQQFSMGPGQVMGSVARELGYSGPLGALMTDELGIEYCAKFLKKLSSKYSNAADIFAAYNAGSPRKKTDSSEYVNQDYVNKAMYWLSYYSSVVDTFTSI